MRILLAIDGSAYSEAAVDEVASRPWPAGSGVKIISALEPPLAIVAEEWVPPDDYLKQWERSGLEKLLAVISRAADRIRAGTHLEVTTEIGRGTAKEVILDEAGRWGADLIVVGSHGYRDWQRFLLGSVSHAVAAHAKCSVEIVRRHQTGESVGG